MKKGLSIDGGGIRGIIPALILAEIERRTNKKIHELFDMVAGTSTGGIISLSLSVPNDKGCAKFSANDVAYMYEKKGKRIFKTNFFQSMKTLWGTAQCSYDHAGIENVLGEYLGITLMENAVTDVMVTSYDIRNRSPYFFKSWNEENKGVPMAIAARATSAAPTYFEPLQVNIHGDVKILVDGGIFVNNPAISAYAEAKRMYGDNEKVTVVSLGTGESVKQVSYEESKKWGKIGWAPNILNFTFDGSSDAVDYQCDRILGDRFMRIQTTLELASDSMDDASESNIINLKKQAAKCIKDNSDNIDRIIKMLL